MNTLQRQSAIIVVYSPSSTVRKLKRTPAKTPGTPGVFYLVAVILVVSLILTSIPLPAQVQASPSPTGFSSCPAQQLRLREDALSSSVGTESAAQSAIRSGVYGRTSQGYSSTFDSIFNIMKFDADCSIHWWTLNVVFSLKNGTDTIGKLVISENPQSLEVYNASLQKNLPSAYQDPSASSYEFTGNSAGTTAVYEATAASWTVPTANVPSQGCWFYHCDLGIWPGLENQYRGTSGIVQGGSDSGVSCYPFCITSYWGWYEFYTSGATYTRCTGMNVNSGDSFYTDVYNYAAGGGPSNKWDIVVIDYTTSTSCSVTGHTFAFTNSGLPYIAAFEGERLAYPSLGYAARLPQFSQYTTFGSMWYNGASQSIYAAYRVGYFHLVYMVNDGSHNNCPGQDLGSNICISSIGTSGQFTQTWATSAGT